MSAKCLAVVFLLLAATFSSAVPALAGHRDVRVVIVDDRRPGWGWHGPHHRHHHWRGCDRVYYRESYRPCPPPSRTYVKEVWVSRPGW